MVNESDSLWALEEVRSGSCWRKSYGMMTTCHMSKYPAKLQHSRASASASYSRKAETYTECRVALHDTPAPMTFREPGRPASYRHEACAAVQNPGI